MGVDYAVFDCGVLNGVGTAARIVQGRVGVDVDGDIGPDTIGACARADKPTLINQICDDRLRRMQALSTWPTFGVGWTKRVERVRADALRMAGAAPTAPVSVPQTQPAPAASDVDLAQLQQAIERLEAQMSNMNLKLPLQLSALPSSPAGVADLVQQALTVFQTMNTASAQTAVAVKPTQDQIKQFTDLLLALTGAASGTSGATTTPAAAATDTLGQVNGALGATIGNLLNGKKSAIGIIGAVLTSILGSAPVGSALGTVAASVPTLAGLSPTFLPIFLAIAAWGVLGKMEKWSPPSTDGK